VTSLADAISGLDLLSESLVSQHLLLLEDFSGEADLKVDDGLLVYDAAFGSAVVYEEFLVINNDSFTFFNVAHEATVEVRMEVVLLQIFESLLLMSVSSFMCSIVFPYGSYPHYLHCLRRRRFNFDLSGLMIDSTEEGPRILDVELVFFEFQDLVLVHIEVRVGFQERSDGTVHDGGS